MVLVIDKSFEIIDSDNPLYIGSTLSSITSKSIERKILQKTPPLSFQHRSKNGRLDISILKLHECFVVNITDIEEKEKLEEKIKKLEKYSYRDYLTKVYNRAGFWDSAIPFVYRLSRENEMLGVLFLDIDDLKAINTKYGYKGGDRLIVRVAETILNSTRKSDIVGRFGGDEFVILLSLKKENDLKRVSNRIAKMVSSLNIDDSVSIGAVLLSKEQLNAVRSQKDLKRALTKYINIAERLSAKAKDLGKNRYCI